MKRFFNKHHFLIALFFIAAFFLFLINFKDKTIEAHLLEKQILIDKTDNNDDQVSIKIVTDVSYSEIEDVHFNLDVDKDKAITQGMYSTIDDSSGYTMFIFPYKYNKSELDLYNLLNSDPDLFTVSFITKKGESIKLTDTSKLN